MTQQEHSLPDFDVLCPQIRGVVCNPCDRTLEHEDGFGSPGGRGF